MGVMHHFGGSDRTARRSSGRASFCSVARGRSPGTAQIADSDTTTGIRVTTSVCQAWVHRTINARYGEIVSTLANIGARMRPSGDEFRTD